MIWSFVIGLGFTTQFGAVVYWITPLGVLASLGLGATVTFLLAALANRVVEGL